VRSEFHETVALTAERSAVWETVGDITKVLDWISIVGSADEVEPGQRYTAVLQDRIGPFKLRADLAIAVTEREEGRRIRAHAEGEDRQIGSRLNIHVLLDLREEGGASVLDVSGSYEVTGRPAALGASSIRKKANTILAEFFARAERELVAGKSRSAPLAPEDSRP
jgi:carbon monoxide dehydrogenase subunit G